MVAEPVDFVARRRVMADQQSRRPKGAITGDAQVILDALDDLNLPESFKKFVRKIRKLTYYNAGYHVQDGTEEHTCYFSLKVWAEELGLSRQFLCNLRADLIVHQVITYTPIPDSPHHGVIAWNMDVSKWTPFKKGGARPGAGRPKKNQSVYKDNQSMYDSGNQSVYETHSIGVQSEINRCTTNGHEDSEPQGLTAPLRNSTKKPRRNGETIVSFGADASADTPTEVLPPLEDATKTTVPKKQKRAPPTFTEDDLDFQTARYLRNAIHRYAPKAALPPDTVKGLQAWANDMRLLRDGSHKRAREDIKTAILFTERTAKWQSYVLSPSGLRRWFDAILQQAEAQREGKANGQHQPVSTARSFDSERADSPAITARREELRRQKQRDRRGNGDDPPAA